MKYFKLLVLLSIFLKAEDTMLDSAIGGMINIWNKTSQLSSEVVDITAEYSIKGKNILIEETLLNGINALVDTDKIKVKVFDIDDKTNNIKIELFLKGESDTLKIEIKNFDWSVTETKEHIVIENLKIDINIPWIEYIVKDMQKRDNGYIKFPHDVTLFSLLYSIKPNIKTTYKYGKKQPFDIVKYPYDKNFIKITNFEVKNKNIFIDAYFKGSGDNQFIIKNYKALPANKRTLLVIKMEEFIANGKPWLKSIIDGQNKEIHLEFSNDLYNLVK